MTSLSLDGKIEDKEIVLLNFSRIQNTDANITLSIRNGNIPLYHVEGKTGNTSAVFPTYKEDSSRYISIILENATKENFDQVRGEPQISFSFDLRGIRRTIN